MNLNDLQRLTDSPAFRGGQKQVVDKLAQEAQKQAPKLLESIGKVIQQILR